MDHYLEKKSIYLINNFSEQKLYEILNNDYIDIKNQFKKDWSKNIETNKYLIYDFVLEKEKIIIELDGEQHFRQVSNWSSL